MTSLIAWVAADSRGPSSLNIATDSRITWSVDGSLSHYWDRGRKVFASASKPLIVGYVGDVLFPNLVIPNILDRIDRSVFRSDGALLDGFTSAVRHEWRGYPASERRGMSIYLGFRSGVGMSAAFRLRKLVYKSGGSGEWQTAEIPVPSSPSTWLVIDGSGRSAVEGALKQWQAGSAANTSRAVFSGFVDAVVSGIDPKSGGAPQLAGLYRIGTGRLFGIVHQDERYFAGARLLGDEAVDGIEWRNALFERTDGRTRLRLPGAQAQARPMN